MSWKDRVKGFIVLGSPEGDLFTAKWAGNDQTISKKLGIFNAPNIKGSQVQDLDVESESYPITIYFDGEDHDLVATKFFEALKSNGLWEIDHPTDGFLDLQLISATKKNQPVTQGGYTQFNTDWIKPISGGVIITDSELSEAVKNEGFFANIASSAQFAANAIQEKVSEIRDLSVAASEVLTKVRTTLYAIENFEIVPAEFEALVRGIESTIASSPIDPSLLAGQIQNLVQIFAPTSKSTTKGVEGYQLFTDSIASDGPSANINQAAISELALTSAITATSTTLLVGGEKTRKEAINNSQAILKYFKNVTDILDETQELYKDEDIDLQYFSQSESYATSLNLTTIAAAYKLRSAFGLAVEKRFILDKPWTPIAITINEYEDAERFDEFIEINELGGDEIYLLAAGREVVVYA